jgi:hypothetical protein
MVVRSLTKNVRFLTKNNNANGCASLRKTIMPMVVRSLRRSENGEALCSSEKARHVKATPDFLRGEQRQTTFLEGRRENCASGFGGGVEVEGLYEHAEDVFEGEVGLLDVHGDGGGDDDVVVAEVAHFSAAGAGEADGDEVLLAGLVEGVEDVGGVAGGRDGEEDVAGLTEGFDLAGEDLIEAEVVAAGGEDGGVGGEGDGAEGGAGVFEADDELGDEVLGVGGGASVAGDEELVAGLHGGGGELGDGDESVGDGFVGEDGLEGGDGLDELSLD